MESAIKIVGDKMKEIEQTSSGIAIIPRESPFIIRIDGRSFSKYTKNLKKPFDERFTAAMNFATYECIKEFNAEYAYTFSDEISFVFKGNDSPDSNDPTQNLQNHMFNGRIMKICSLIAAYASVAFNNKMRELFANETDPIYEKIKCHTAIFDARIMVFEKDDEVSINNALWWRHADSYRNAINGCARVYYTSKEMMNKTLGVVIEMIKEKNNGIIPLSEAQKHGVIIKKTKIENSINGEIFLRSAYHEEVFIGELIARQKYF